MRGMRVSASPRATIHETVTMTNQITARLAGLIALSATVAPLAASAAPAQPQVVPDRYMVIFKDSVPNPALEADKLVRASGGQLHYVYSHALHGFAATLPAQALDAIRRSPNVAYVEQDQVVTADATQGGATWGIDRIDQRSLPLNGSYTYDYNGAGVYAFVIDTGILATHVDFGGRVLPGSGYDAVGDGNGTSDCNGHGTHVAGTVGGNTYGVAKGVSLVPIRVLNCQGSGTSSGVAAGLDYVTGRTDLRPAVGNMSLGGGVSSTIDTAVSNAVKSGVTLAVAAGNSSADACNYSPARAPSAITVGATTSTDAQASYSNYGTCLDLYAPGSSITSDYYSSTTATATMSGTSMATPHVAGVAALVLSANPSATPATVAQTIVANATPDKVTSIGTGSPNLLLYSLTGAPPANTPPVASFTFSCTNLSCSFNGSGSSDPDGSIASYAWRFGDGGTATGSSASHAYAAAGTYTATLTVTDNGGATGSTSKSVTVTAPVTSTTLTGSANVTGKTWTAKATLTGPVGASTSGSWNYGTGTAAAGCTIAGGATSCSFPLSKIPLTTLAVSYADKVNAALALTIKKP